MVETPPTRHHADVKVTTMKRTSALAAVVVALLITVAASPGYGAPSNAALQKQVKALKAQVKRQQTAINQRNATIRTMNTRTRRANTDLTAAQAALAASHAEVASLRAAISAEVAARVAVMTPEEAWSIIPALYARFPDSAEPWSRSYNNFSGWESYTFNRWP